MKLYRTSVVLNDPDGIGPKAVWSGSQAEASKDRTAFRDAGIKRDAIKTMEVNVPTDKQNLLAWLNSMGV